MDLGGNFGGRSEGNLSFWLSALASELSQVTEGSTPQNWQELLQVGETVNTTTQQPILELVEAVRSQCVQEFRALIIPDVVQAVRSQCAQELQAFIPIMVDKMKEIVHSAGLRSSSPDRVESSAPRSMQ